MCKQAYYADLSAVIEICSSCHTANQGWRTIAEDDSAVPLLSF